MTIPATSADTSIGAVFTRVSITPATDTLYRIGNWKHDGSPQYNVNYYSVYGTNSASIDGLVPVALSENGIDDNPTPGSTNLVASGGVAGSIVYDISAAHAGAVYEDLATALGVDGVNVPEPIRKGGMSIKFMQTIHTSYSVVKIEGLETQPIGTEVSVNPNINNGTYTAAQLNSAFSTLPTSTGPINAITYWMAVSGDSTTYTKWVITLVQTSGNKCVQYMLMSSSFSTNEADWQGVDDEPIAGSDNLVKSGGVASFVYPEFKGYLVNELMSRIEPDSIQENSIMLADTTITSFNELQVVTISVAAGELILVDNNDGYSPHFCVFAVFDANTNELLYKKVGGIIDFHGKYLQYKTHVIIKYSIYSYLWDSGHGIFKVNDTDLSGFIKAQAKQNAIDLSRVRFLGILPPKDSLELIDLTQYNSTVGIFEDSVQTLYRTTDYIPLSDFNYIYKPGNGMNAYYSFFRLYDADKNLLYDQKAGFMGVMDINANGIAYIRVVYFATNNNFEFYSYKHINKTFDDFISALGG